MLVEHLSPKFTPAHTYNPIFCPKTSQVGKKTGKILILPFLSKGRLNLWAKYLALQEKHNSFLLKTLILSCSISYRIFYSLETSNFEILMGWSQPRGLIELPLVTFLPLTSLIPLLYLLGNLKIIFRGFSLEAQGGCHLRFSGFCPLRGGTPLFR